MTNGEAVKLLAVFASYWRSNLDEETAFLWAKSIRQFEVEDVAEAAEILGRTFVYMPSLAEFEAVIRDCRNTRIQQQSTPLPSGDYYPFAKFLHDHPEMAERVKRLQGGLIGHTFATLLQDEMS